MVIVVPTSLKKSNKQIVHASTIIQFADDFMIDESQVDFFRVVNAEKFNIYDNDNILLIAENDIYIGRAHLKDEFEIEYADGKNHETMYIVKVVTKPQPLEDGFLNKRRAVLDFVAVGEGAELNNCAELALAKPSETANNSSTSIGGSLGVSLAGPIVSVSGSLSSIREGVDIDNVWNTSNRSWYVKYDVDLDIVNPSDILGFASGSSNEFLFSFSVRSDTEFHVQRFQITLGYNIWVDSYLGGLFDSFEYDLPIIYYKGYETLFAPTDITLDAEGGTVSNGSNGWNWNSSTGKFTQNLSSLNQLFDLPSSTPTKSGYKFEGWWTGPNGTGTQLVVPYEDIRNLTGCTTFYAKWSRMIVNNVINLQCVYVRGQKTWHIYAIAAYKITSNIHATIGGPCGIAFVPIEIGNESGSFSYAHDYYHYEWGYIGLSLSQDDTYYYIKGTVTYIII